MGKASLAALNDLIALAQQVTALPTFPAGNAISPQEDPKLIFQGAWTWFSDVLATAQQINDAQDAPVVIQDLCAAYLALRNALPLAAVQHGSLANNHDEQVLAKRLDEWESGAVQPAIPGAVQQAL